MSQFSVVSGSTLAVISVQVEEIEREIEQMRISRGATLEGQDQADSQLDERIFCSDTVEKLRIFKIGL